MHRATAVIRVVLADNEDLVLDGLTTVLEADPRIRVVGRVGNANALLSVVPRLMPDVVLLDVRMPGMGGLTALRRLPKSPPPYCALLTGYDLDEYVQAALEAGAQGFLLKDSPPDALVRAVHDLANGGAVIDPRIAVRLLPRLRGLPSDDLAAELVGGLSDRERDVLLLLGEGASNAVIGRTLSITESTVKGHVTRVLVKLGVENRVQAALFAQKLRDPAP